MKSRVMIICIFAMMCIWAGITAAQDNVPLPPGYGGQMGDNVPLPPGYGAGMVDAVPPPPGYGGGMGMMPGMPAGATGMNDQEFPDDAVARCLLKISCDPSMFQLDYRTIKHLWNSTGVLNKAYRKVLNDPNTLECSGYILLLNGTGTLVDTMYSVAIPDRGNGKEKDILAAAVENLKSALARMGDQESQKLRERLALTEERGMEMEKQVAGMQEQVRAITQEGVTNRQEVQKKIGDLMNAVSDSEMRLRYSDNRIHELRRQKEDIQKAIEKAVSADSIAQELQTMIEEANFLVSQSEKAFSTGTIPAEKVQEAKEKLARAKIELAKRLEEVRDKAGREQLVEIDNKIADATSQISETAVMKNFSAEEYQKAKELLAKSDELELLEMKLDATKRSYFETLNARENLKSRLLMQQPLSISVIGME